MADSPSASPFDSESPEYRAYHRRVVDAIRLRFQERWPNLTPEYVEACARFFNEQCTYDEYFLEGTDPEEFVDDEIDAAIG